MSLLLATNITKNQKTPIKPKAVSEPKTPSSTQKKEEAEKNLSLLLEHCRENIARRCLEEKNKEEGLTPLLQEEALTQEDLLLKRKKQKDPLACLPEPPSLLLSRLLVTSEAIAPSPVHPSDLSLALFDRVCSELLVMNAEDSQITTLTLQNQEFQNSPFFGAKITLEEFSTAPKIFNVSIQTTQEAMALIQSHVVQFMELLQDRKFSFGINRIDTALLQEKDEQKDGSGENDQNEKRDS